MQPWARVVVAVAAARVAVALALYLSGQVVYRIPPPLPLALYAILSAAFVLLGLTLFLANRHDVRAAWLGGIFVLVSLPLSSPFLVQGAGWLQSIRADVFLPAFFWRDVGRDAELVWQPCDQSTTPFLPFYPRPGWRERRLHQDRWRTVRSSDDERRLIAARAR